MPCCSTTATTPSSATSRVEPRTLIFAKLLALAAFVGLFAVAVSLFPSIAFPLVVLATEKVDSAFAFRMIAAQSVATLAGSLFAFFAVVALRGLVAQVAGDRTSRSVLPIVQFALVLVLLMLLLLSPWLAEMARDGMTAASPLLIWWPPMWFIGLNEWLIGRPTPIAETLAITGGAALAVAAAVAAATYALSSARATQTLRETSTASAPGRGIGARLLRLAAAVVARHPLTRASFFFTAHTLARSARHRLYVAGYLGAGLAVVIVCLALLAREIGWQAFTQPLPTLLAAQAQLILFALLGARVAAALPAELRSNWVFQLLSRPELGRYLAGARRAVLVQVALPLLLVLAPVHLALWGPAVAAWHFAAGGAMAIVLVGALFAGFPKVPFTCPYVAGKADLKVRLPFYLIAYWVIVYPPTALEHHALQHPRTLIPIASMLAVLLVGLAAQRWLWLRRRPEPEFFDQTEPAVQALGLID